MRKFVISIAFHHHYSYTEFANAMAFAKLLAVLVALTALNIITIAHSRYDAFDRGSDDPLSIPPRYHSVGEFY